MGFKEMVKRAVPSSVMDIRRDYKRMAIARAHSKMTRAQIETWLSQRYFERIGAPLNLGNPERYTEKIQWCKLNAMNAMKSYLSDKYAVREWVADRIGRQHLIPLLKVWEDPADIDFSKLPDSFVLKTNNASATNIIVQDKTKLDTKRVRAQLKRWLNVDFGWLTFEPQYLSIPPKVIAEEYICNSDESEIADYKVLCFGGEPAYIWVDTDRHSYHSRAVFDTDWNLQAWNQYHYPDVLQTPDRPSALNDMIELARQLSTGFAQVRVDFYIVNDTVLFGEMTFTNGSGFEEIHPIEWDYKLGDLWDLSAEPCCDSSSLVEAK